MKRLILALLVVVGVGFVIWSKRPSRMQLGPSYEHHGLAYTIVDIRGGKGTITTADQGTTSFSTCHALVEVTGPAARMTPPALHTIGMRIDRTFRNGSFTLSADTSQRASANQTLKLRPEFVFVWFCLVSDEFQACKELFEKNKQDQFRGMARSLPGFYSDCYGTSEKPAPREIVSLHDMIFTSVLPAPIRKCDRWSRAKEFVQLVRAAGG